jgi:carboxyl-terminal processing protease
VRRETQSLILASAHQCNRGWLRLGWGLLLFSGGLSACNGCRSAESLAVTLDATQSVAADDAGALTTTEPALVLVMPTGEPAQLQCEQAQQIADQLRTVLPFAAAKPDMAEFAAAVRSAADPYGLWSAADDYAGEALLNSAADSLALELDEGDCHVATEVGASLNQWIAKLSANFDAGRTSNAPNHKGAANHVQVTPKSATAFAATAALVATPVWPRHLSPLLAATQPQRNSRDDRSADAHTSKSATPRKLLAAARMLQLGSASAAIARAAPELAVYTDKFRTRTLPQLSSAGWQRIVLAASVRSYASLIDAHGAWVPRSEEATLYELDLDEIAPGRLWKSATPLLVGAQIEEGALAPLLDRDIVLEVDGSMVAGFSPEDLHQAARAAFTTKARVDVKVWRNAKIEVLSIDRNAAPLADPDLPGLRAELIPLAEGNLLWVQVPDIHESFGVDLASALHEHGTAAARGIVLDLRGNGGGSMEGALGGLAQFLPGLPMFPMRDREGTLEPDVTAETPEATYAGPIAILVDGHTASAAEMIAGALAAYHRGTVIGARTYGKGCIQEFLPDASGVGILKATTMLYALPDGKSVQRTGILPTLDFPFRVDDEEREESQAYAPPSFRALDVRPTATSYAAFRAPLVPTGKCTDANVCAAIAALNRTLR